MMARTRHIRESAERALPWELSWGCARGRLRRFRPLGVSGYHFRPMRMRENARFIYFAIPEDPEFLRPMGVVSISHGQRAG